VGNPTGHASPTFAHAVSSSWEATNRPRDRELPGYSSRTTPHKSHFVALCCNSG